MSIAASIVYTQEYIQPQAVNVGFIGLVSSQCPVSLPLRDIGRVIPMAYEIDPQIADQEVATPIVSRVLP